MQGVSGKKKASRDLLLHRAHSSKIGRPTKSEADERQRELLDAAVDLFLEMGYQEATLELIASSVGMTKRTIYSRHADKAALFKATVQRGIERMVQSQPEKLNDLRAADLETVLREIARMRIQQVLSPIGLKLQRLVNAESMRFPEIFVSANEQITGPVVSFLSEMFRKRSELGEIEVDRPDVAATVFLSMVAGAPARVLASGNIVDEGAIADRIDFSVRLVLDGLRPKS